LIEKDINRERCEDDWGAMEIEEIASKIVAAAIKVHTALGPGLLESAYQRCMAYELARDGSKVECVKLSCRSNMMISILTQVIG
jgi:hypothetical protein